MGDRYLRTLFGFLGITDFITLPIENLDIVGQNVQMVVDKAKEKAESLVKDF